MDYTRQGCVPSHTYDAWLELIMAGGEGKVGGKNFSKGFSRRMLVFDC